MKETKSVSVRISKDLKDEIMNILEDNNMTFTKVFSKKIENMIKREIKRLGSK